MQEESAHRKSKETNSDSVESNGHGNEDGGGIVVAEKSGGRTKKNARNGGGGSKKNNNNNNNSNAKSSSSSSKAAATMSDGSSAIGNLQITEQIYFWNSALQFDLKAFNLLYKKSK